MILTLIYWALALFIGLPLLLISLSMFFARKAVEINQDIGTANIIEIEPEKLPGIPAKKLRHLVREIQQRGYTLILGYTAGGMSTALARSYSFVLFDKKNKTYAEAFYMKPQLIWVVLSFIIDRKNFHTHVLSYAFYSAWDDGSRLVTTPEKSVVGDLLNRDKSLVLTDLDIDSLIQRHEAALLEHESNHGEARAFKTKEDYFVYFKQRTKLISLLGPQTVEDCLAAEIEK
jgi:hypothetical protein